MFKLTKSINIFNRTQIMSTYYIHIYL